MNFIRLLKHLLTSIWQNATPLQAILIISIILAIIVILILSVVQILVPFTYIAI